LIESRSLGVLDTRMRGYDDCGIEPAVRTLGSVSQT
jgi:hypothetical protein